MTADRKYKVRTSWINDNTFCVRVEEYEKVKKAFIYKTWKLKQVHEYASWESFISIMWEKHMLSGKTIFEIDSKI